MNVRGGGEVQGHTPLTNCLRLVCALKMPAPEEVACKHWVFSAKAMIS